MTNTVRFWLVAILGFLFIIGQLLFDFWIPRQMMGRAVPGGVHEIMFCTMAGSMVISINVWFSLLSWFDVRE